MSKRVRVSVTLDDKKVTFEGPEEFVREQIDRLVGVRPVTAAADSGASTGRLSPPPEVRDSAFSEREFIAQKQPSGHAEITTVLAYILAKQGSTEFTPEEIRRAYIRAGVRPPKVMAQALRDAKNLYDYLQPGSKKGTFSLSEHGERTVLFDLPRSQGSAQNRGG
jgi:hypothetical protein